jgi:hypothetical protein
MDGQRRRGPAIARCKFLLAAAAVAGCAQLPPPRSDGPGIHVSYLRVPARRGTRLVPLFRKAGAHVPFYERDLVEELADDPPAQAVAVDARFRADLGSGFLLAAPALMLSGVVDGAIEGVLLGRDALPTVTALASAALASLITGLLVQHTYGAKLREALDLYNAHAARRERY